LNDSGSEEFRFETCLALRNEVKKGQDNQIFNPLRFISRVVFCLLQGFGGIINFIPFIKRIKMVKRDSTSIKCKYFIDLLMKQKDNYIARRIRTCIDPIDPKAKEIIFGSRARGDAKKESDWDILILTEFPVTYEIERSFSKIRS
jgi:hypothetical protein